MALIRTGNGITQISGSFGGVVAQRSRSGPTMRARIAGLQPRTAYQAMVRSLHQSLSRAWSNTLTDAERIAWRAFAASHPTLNRLGNTQLLSGFAFFVSLNTRAISAGGTLFTTPPASLAVTALTGAIPSAAAPNLFASGTGPAIPAAEDLKFTMTQALPPGVFYFYNKLYTMQYDHTINASVDVTAAYEAKWGPVPFGSGLIIYQGASIVNKTTGAESVVVYGSVIL